MIIKRYSETALVSGLRNQDAVAFQYLYDNYAPAIYGIIRKSITNAPVADDVLQKVFEMVWKECSAHDPTQRRLFTWLTLIARDIIFATLNGETDQDLLLQSKSNL